MTLRRAALLVLAISLPACAEAPPPASPVAPGAPPAEATPVPRPFEPGAKGPTSDADREMLAIAKAEDEIDRLFAGMSKKAPAKGGKADAPAGDAAKPADKAPAKDEAQSLSGGGADACATACRALASMLSSADHLCKLAGETDGRCEDARGRVRGAGARVRSACPSCTAGAK